jgi:membrane protein
VGTVSRTSAPPSNAGGSSTWHRLTCLNWREVRILVKSTYDGWVADRAPRLGASLAFYTLLSLAPIVIVVIAIAGLAFGEQAAEGRLIWQIQDLVGWQGAVAIQGLLKSARAPGSGVLATIIGLITLFFGASAVVNELREALNTIWHVPPREESSNWRSMVQFLKDRVFSFAMVVGIGFILLVSLILSAWLSAAGKYMAEVLPLPEWVIQVGYSISSFLIITFLFTVLYKVLPNLSLEWTDVTVGAAVTSLLFSIGKYLIGLYLGKTTMANAYGAAGSLVIVLVWVYYSAQIFFFGAEFTRVYTERHGSIFRNRLALQPTAPEARIVEPGEPPKSEGIVLVGERKENET